MGEEIHFNHSINSKRNSSCRRGRNSFRARLYREKLAHSCTSGSRLNPEAPVFVPREVTIVTIPEEPRHRRKIQFDYAALTLDDSDSASEEEMDKKSIYCS